MRPARGDGRRRDRRRGLARRADRAALHPRGAGAAVRAEHAARAAGSCDPRRAGGGAARPAAALHRRRRARLAEVARARPRSRCPRWCGAPRWRTCSCASPAGRWSTDDRDTGAVAGTAARRAARRRALLDAGTGATGGPPSVSSVLQPLLFLLAFGVGFGTLVAGRPSARRPPAASTYLVCIAPALLAAVGRAERRVRVVLPGAVGVQVAARLPRDDRDARSPRRRWRSGTSSGSRSSACSPATVYVVVVAAVRRRRRARGSCWRSLAGRAHRARVRVARHRVRGHRRERRRAFNVVFRLRRHADDAVLRIVLPDRPAAGGRAAARLDLAALARQRAGPGGARSDRWLALAALGHLAYLVALLALGVALAGPVLHPAACSNDRRDDRPAAPGGCPRAAPGSYAAVAAHAALRPPPHAGWSFVSGFFEPCSTCSRWGSGLGALVGTSRARTAAPISYAAFIAPGAAGRVGDERRRLRLHVQRLLQAEVRQALRRDAGHPARPGGRRARRDRLGADPRRALLARLPRRDAGFGLLVSPWALLALPAAL